MPTWVHTAYSPRTAVTLVGMIYIQNSPANPPTKLQQLSATPTGSVLALLTC